jgi:hypothetical protein
MTSTELCQVLKIPVLVSHYTEHRDLNTGITFFMFLKMHYFNGDPRDSDYNTDMQLPFKTTSNALVVNLSSSLPILPQNFLPLSPLKTISSIYTNFYSVWIPSGHLSDIFQPPRNV